MIMCEVYSDHVCGIQWSCVGYTVIMCEVYSGHVWGIQ